MATHAEADAYHRFINSLKPEGRLRAGVRELAGLALLDGLNLKDFTLPEDGYNILERWANVPIDDIRQHDEAINDEITGIRRMFDPNN